MSRLHFPTKEPFVDVKTGYVTDRWREVLDAWNKLLSGDLDFASISGVISLAQLPDHQENHQAGGTDAIKLDELAAPNDITTLNASTTAHGLLPKLSGNAAHRLNGLGQWV